MNTQQTALAVAAMAETAFCKYGPYASPHEFLGVLDEELHELLTAIHANDWDEARREALDIAAVALKFASEITTRETDGTYGKH